MKMKRYLKRREGQAAIEFIVVIVVVFFFLLFFLSLAMLLVVSDYIDYATFMAARTYKSGFSTREFQERYAREIFDTYTQRIQGIARNFTLDFVRSGESEQTSGVVSTYEIDLFYLPPLFAAGDTPVSRITLSSETHLGRDPAFQDCMDFFADYSRRNGLGIEGTSLMTQMDDNGC